MAPPAPPDWRASAGETPFGFEFTRNGTLVVSEAFGGRSDASATSSYRFRPNGNLKVVDGPVARPRPPRAGWRSPATGATRM